MTAWVVKRDDGKYAWYNFRKGECEFVDKIYHATFYEKKCFAEIDLGWSGCKIVKVEIKEVQNGKQTLAKLH